MTAHELAAALLGMPDIPVVINGWRDDAGDTYEVTGVSPPGVCFFTPEDRTIEPGPYSCVFLDHQP